MINNHSTEDLTDPNISQNEFNPKEDIVLLKKIGSGGFGEVYKARIRSKSLKSVCAVKVIRKDDRIEVQEKQMESVQNEISILYALDHPHIIKVLHDWDDSRKINIMFEFASGGDLQDLLQDSIITEDQAKRFILDLGSALDYIHKKKIIHRDVKLENILLTENNVIKLTDFGLAVKAPDGLAYEDCGTPYAKAPEVISQYPYDKAVDWWAVGVVLYQMIVRDDPFKATDGKTLEENIVKTRVKIPLSVPYRCYSLIGKLLQKKPNSRINSFDDLTSHRFFKGV